MQSRQEHFRFALVALVVGLFAISSVWWLVHNTGLVDVSLRDVSRSDLLPPVGVLLFRFSCAAVSLFTLLSVYRDKKGLELQYKAVKVHLRGLGRWTTFTTWCFSILFLYFAFATCCSAAVVFGFGEDVPLSIVESTLILFEISYPTSILVTSVVTFVLFPLAQKHGRSTDRMFRWRPQVLHNWNVLMMQTAMLIAPPPMTFSHFPYAALFGCCYAAFSWLWFQRTRVFYYFFLDYRRPYAALTYLGLFAVIAVFYGVGLLVAEIANLNRWMAYPCIMLATLGITRFRAPAMKAEAAS